MIKKIAALIMSVLLLLQLTPAFAFSDTEGTDYEEAVYVLSELDIIGGYEDKTFRPENSITRAEFAAMVVRLLDTSIYDIPKEQVFSDVDKKHWAYEFVNAGYHIGYFSGYGDGTFAPEENISFSEIVKTVVTILGYKPIAEAKGGYPTGYITIANEKKLLQGLSLGNNEYVTRGDVALLLYNSLNKPKLEQTVFGDDDIEYTEDAGRTILTDELKVARYDGVVSATRHTGLYGMAALSEDEILIGDTKLAVGQSDIASYLGYNLVVYAKKDAKTKDETVLFYEIKEDNIVTTVVANDIDSSTNLNYFSYWDGDKQNSTALSSDIQFIVNAKYEPFALSDDLKPNSGTVTLLNNDGDRDVDIVIVKNYTHYVVSGIDTNDLIIYDAYGKAPLELEPAGKTVDYVIFRNGRTAKVDSITVDTVLSVLKSVDGEYMEIHIVPNTVKGKVVGTEDADTYIIGEEGAAYKRSADLPDSEIIKLGDEGTFYLDIEGKIIKIDAGSSTEGNYGYLTGAAITAGLEGELQFRVFNSEGNFVTLTAAEKVRFNGANETKENILTFFGGAGNVTEQPIRYALNSEGKVSKIDIPSVDFATGNRYYRRNTKMFGYRNSTGFLIDGNKTVMFQVPTGGDGDDDNYKVLKYDSLPVYNYQYSVTGYDLDGLTVGCAVINVDPTASTASISGNCCVLSKITTATNKNGDPCYKLYYMQSGKELEYCVSDKVVLSHYNLTVSANETDATPITITDLKPGDVFHAKTNASDEIISIARVLSVGGTNLSEAPHFRLSRGLSAERVFGVVKRRVGPGLLVHSETETPYDSLFEITTINDGGMYLYDSRTETVRNASYNDIIDIETAPGDPAYVYVSAVTGLVEDVIIFYQGK